MIPKNPLWQKLYDRLIDMNRKNRTIRILAIESSCDDCSVAVVEDGVRVVVNLIASQEAIHAQYGGVVPEVASREHLHTIYRLVDLALERSGLKPQVIDALAVTVGPGLMGSLMVGVDAARTLGWLWDKPVLPVNHLQGHVYAAWLMPQVPKFPVVALVASGGHTEIVLMRKHGEYKYLGGTVDDAVGESFDKIARHLGLGYPGGPAISKLAGEVRVDRLGLPRPMLNTESYDFSFSGLKTAATRVKATKEKVAHAFEEAAVEVLVTKLLKAARQYDAATVVVGGGVAANRRLREAAQVAMGEICPVIFPAMEYCRDNAAMIGAAAYWVSGGKPRGRWYNAKVLDV